MQHEVNGEGSNSPHGLCIFLSLDLDNTLHLLCIYMKANELLINIIFIRKVEG